MANHSPDPNNYQISKTWDEAMEGKPASGDAELPADKPKDTNAARKNGGGADDKK